MDIKKVDNTFLSERFVDETGLEAAVEINQIVNKVQKRSPFAKDRARVLHSAALRKLADKTQVVSPRKNWNPRTRLTHSLEVGQISREIAGSLGLDPDIAEMAGLAHDIGHPPFGHNGERRLNELAADFGGFESNAQNLRILTNLEPKILSPDGNSAGLNLTRASLDATIKYPWEFDGVNPKFGVYESEKEIFTWIRKNSNSTEPSIYAQVMEWADDIAYSVHDVEDGTIAKRINLQELADAGSRKDLANLAVKHNLGTDTNELEDAAKRLADSSIVKAVFNYEGSLTDSINLKKFTSFFVSRFCNSLVASTDDRNLQQITIDNRIINEVNILKALAMKYINYDSQHLAELKVQREIITAVFELLWATAPNTLDPVLLANWRRANSDAERKRIIIDQIAGMTESQITSFVYKN